MYSLNSYRPISFLAVLLNILDTSVSNQFKEFPQADALIAEHQSGGRKQHSTITGTMVHMVVCK